jgi:DNA (cytosine-5)-methyltransferase 1
VPVICGDIPLKSGSRVRRKSLITTNKPLRRISANHAVFQDIVLDGHFVLAGRDRGAKSGSAGKVVSLFTGAGGLEIGLEAAGFETAAYVEIDQDCRKTIAKNRGWTFVDTGRGDIRSTKSVDILAAANAKPGEIAIVSGGAPCQPFSNIGKRDGTQSEDGNLFQDFIRVVRDLRPQAFIFENVSAIAGAKHAAVLETISSNAKRIGYGVALRILNSADYGVPQRRRRLIAIGIRDAQASVGMPYPTNASDPAKLRQQYIDADLTPPARTKPWRTVRDAIGKLSARDFERDDCRLMTVSPLTLARMRHIRPGTRDNFKALPDKLLPDCWRSGRHQGADTFGRMLWDEPAVTIRTSGYHPMKGRYIHPDQDRGFNTVELMRLQAFPPGYRFEGGLISVGRQIGNAVPPPLAEAIGLAIRHQLEIPRGR